MEQCLFCRIIKGEIPAEKIYEDSESLAFLDIYPRAPGHTVVIPRFHAPTIVDLPQSNIGGLFSTVRRVARGLEVALQAAGLTIGINQGKVSGQEIEHLHIHLLPRFVNDGGGSIQSVVNNQPKENVADMAINIRQSISKFL